MAKKPLALDSFLANEAKLQMTDSARGTEKRVGAKKGKSSDKTQNSILSEQTNTDTSVAKARTDKFKKKRIGQTVYLPPPVHRQLRALAFEEERKMHDYLMEGLDLVFRKRGLKSVAELSDATD